MNETSSCSNRLKPFIPRVREKIFRQIRTIKTNENNKKTILKKERKTITENGFEIIIRKH